VGWYLMLGAPTPKPGIRNYDVPLPKWEQMGGYDTATDCEADSVRRWNLAKQDGYETGAKMWLHAKCVASDDPRLKAK